MQRVAIIGGGISGLSAGFYAKKFNPIINLHIYEGNKIGGWIQTTQKNGFITENGPRNFRFNSKVVPLLNIVNDIGIIDQVLCADTQDSQMQIRTKGEFIDVMPSGNMKVLKVLLNFPLYRRVIFSNLFSNLFRKSKEKEVITQEYDLSLKDFIEKFIYFSNEEDKDFIVNILTDSFVQGIYFGDISKLSARFCYPFSQIFKKSLQIKFENHSLMNDIETSSDDILDLVNQASQKNSNCMNFVGGMTVLPNAIYRHLNRQKNFKLIKETVQSIEIKDNKPLLNTESGSFEYDHVISTVPAKSLKKILGGKIPEIGQICDKIPHNSLKNVSLGFENLNVKGAGYIIPSREQNAISSVLFDSCSFPYLRNTVSLMGPLTSPTEKMIEDFITHTGTKEQIIHTNVVECIEALPQYNVKHHLLIEEVQKLSPSWLSVSGQSFYLSGIQNCIIQSRDLVSKLFLDKVLKNPLL
ncbi:hypothetical protein SteCoe_13584 [Stentor coeruleus]|uniref:Protoporphyrinogen oxidase n=1 Tax=Stentor coeruleus TaxID=5963 RepID=A0A1R2C847_9CILI|nr:hypothetical protein SteCoe_18834 [Stentor coeruleus]OMJ85188.1 hypothetical protein SteCoe_13584 [Stentor coeruleus]